MKPALLRVLCGAVIMLACTGCATNDAGQTWLRWWILHGD